MDSTSANRWIASSRSNPLIFPPSINCIIQISNAAFHSVFGLIGPVRTIYAVKIAQ